MNDSKRQLGIVNRWNDARGFGFIRAAVEDFKGRIVRVNDRAIKDTFLLSGQARRDGIVDIGEGDILQFEVGTDRRTGRPHAINISRIQRNVLDEKTAA
jgi:cold shock CspA family protein